MCIGLFGGIFFLALGFLMLWVGLSIKDDEASPLFGIMAITFFFLGGMILSSILLEYIDGTSSISVVLRNDGKVDRVLDKKGIYFTIPCAQVEELPLLKETWKYVPVSSSEKEEVRGILIFHWKAPKDLTLDLFSLLGKEYLPRLEGPAIDESIRAFKEKFLEKIKKEDLSAEEVKTISTIFREAVVNKVVSLGLLTEGEARKAFSGLRVEILRKVTEIEEERNEEEIGFVPIMPVPPSIFTPH